jgi:hypothetical protein
MRRYWWVNHKQTVEHEVGGKYLWSPKTKKGGKPNLFYKNMRLAAPGDYVLSFAHGRIAYVGRVLEFAIAAPKPLEFGSAGDAWADEGWYLPVQWSTLDTPVRPKEFIGEILNLLPPTHSPIQGNGNGNQGAYLAEIRFELFQAVLARAGVDLDLVFSDIELASTFGTYVEELDDAVERQLSLSTALTITEKSQVVKARRGQGLFRANVQKYEKCCRLTGVTTQYLLIASHIKPWRSCESAAERLDGNNGLLLTPHVDLMFDRGLISFQNDGALIISTRIEGSDLQLLGIRVGHLVQRSLSPQQVGYMTYHRANVFVP